MGTIEMAIVSTILTFLLMFALIRAATDFARQWVRHIVLKELDYIIRTAQKPIGDEDEKA